jgi:peptide/nickel transport system permease protein
MKAARFIIKRVFEAIVSLFILSFVIFSLIFMAPGDPARVLVGTKNASPELLDTIRNKYHLNEPFFDQYGLWLKKVFSLDFGESIRTGNDVISTIGPYAQTTFQLVSIALILSIFAGLVFGVISARNRGRLADGAINTLAIVGTSAPSFAVGLLFLYIFSLKLHIFPVYGIGDGSFFDTIWHLFLPAITLTFALCTMLIKITRATLLTEIDKDYSLFMRARAIPERTIIASQLKNASAPILTSTGLLLANLFGSAILVETVFAVPGLGGLLAASITFRDVPVIQFITLLFATIVCMVSAIIDISVFFIDPLTRQKRNKIENTKEVA